MFVVYGDMGIINVSRRLENKAKQSQFAVGLLRNWIRRSGSVRFRNFLEEDALAGIVFGVEGEFVVMKFLGIDDVFGEAEPVGPPGLAVCGNRAYEKVTGPAFDDVVTEFDAKVVYCYFDDKLPLLVGVLHCPQARFVNSFAAHLHLYSGSPARLKFCPADTDYRGGDFAVRLEDEFPAAFGRSPCADEKIRELPDAVDSDLDAVFVSRRVPAAGQCNGEKKINQQE